MNVTALKSDIITWLKTLPYWSQYVGEKLLTGASLTNDLVDNTYQFFLEDETLVPKTANRNLIQFATAPTASQNLTNIKITQIKDIVGVNALAADQQMQFGGQLSAVYGNNGTGKSGYIRMINNAFNGRGDKQMLGNVYNTGPSPTPNCEFLFEEAGVVRIVPYPSAKTDAAFSRFSVFDNLAGRIHLEQENTLHFTPGGFDFFNQYTGILEQLKIKLNQDIQMRTKPNTFAQMFVKGGAIEVLVNILSATSDLSKLKNMAAYVQTDIDRYQQLAVERSQLQAHNIPSRIGEKEESLKQLALFKANCNSYLAAFSSASIEEINKQMAGLVELQERVHKEGMDSLSDYEIQVAGSPQWREFITAARNYATLVNMDKEASAAYPTEGDTCLFCLQPLSSRESVLIEAYWKLLKSEAEDKLKATKTWLAQKFTGLSSYPRLFFDGTVSLYSVVQSLSPTIAETWNLNTTMLNDAMTKIRNDLTSMLPCNVQPASFNTAELEGIETTLKAQVEDLKTKDPAKEIARIDQEMASLNDKNTLSKVITQIGAYVDELKWVTKATKGLGSLKTNAVTSKQGELFDKYVTVQYEALFLEECKKLKVPAAIRIAQRNAKGQTLRKLQISSTSVSRVLSEGEQRAACLADFLTEAQLDPLCCGAIFDDPVTSLDHERREDIAKRLVELSATKQVIIFTHDIAFLHRLTALFYATHGREPSVVTLRRFGGSIGVIESDLPWIAMSVKKRVGYLKNKLVALQKIEKTKSQDDYTNAAKAWYGFLREGWERAVEERLLKGVVERFNPGIQTQKLKHLHIDPQYLVDIEAGMTESSRWVHDAAAGLNPSIPDTVKAAQDLSLFENFADRCKAP